MSYCRWSTDGFMCDVYVYASCHDDWTIHVASSRSTKRAPSMPWRLIGKPIIGWLAWKQYSWRYKRWSDNRVLVPIGLACDGESYYMSTPGQAANKLEGLKGLGYNVPQCVIDELWEEDREDDVLSRSCLVQTQVR